MNDAKRWRGRMPYRRSPRLRRVPIYNQGRTGEPSPASALTTEQEQTLQWFREGKLLLDLEKEGEGRAEGSFTEELRNALRAWVEETFGTWWGPVTFEYRLYRHKTVTVVLQAPQIWHKPSWGRGSKGFILSGIVLSFDGKQPAKRKSLQWFALNKIIGQHPIRQMLALSASTQSAQEDI